MKRQGSPAAGEKGLVVALLCYGLLVAAWVVDLLTPQLFVVAILLNGPIALSSLALQSRLTTRLVIAAEIANAIAGYINGVQAGHHWDGIAIGDRLLLAASFVLVGYLSIQAQQSARVAGESAGRMRQIEIERAIREATGRVRGTLNVDLVQRAILRESIALLDASRAMLIVRDSTVHALMVLSVAKGDSEVAYDRRVLSTELASLEVRAREGPGVIRIGAEDALGRLTLDALGASEAFVVPIRVDGSVDDVLVASAVAGAPFVADAVTALGAFSEQAGIALEQARLFTQLGERNDEIAHQKNELAGRNGVIRDIVYALAHDLRTPIAAAEVTMKQAMNGAYGVLPPRYESILRTTLASNADERRIVETLLLVARYEAGEISNVHEPVDTGEIVTRAVDELQPVGEAKGVAVTAEKGAGNLTITGDASELLRAAVNLIANAVAATPEGGRVVARAQRSDAGISIAVEDDGYGVAPGRQATLFERFGGTRAGAGTGLGLYIVRRIAEKYGGSVAYAAREPRGSIFTITLPAENG